MGCRVSEGTHEDERGCCTRVTASTDSEDAEGRRCRCDGGQGREEGVTIPTGHSEDEARGSSIVERRVAVEHAVVAECSTRMCIRAHEDSSHTVSSDERRVAPVLRVRGNDAEHRAADL